MKVLNKKYRENFNDWEAEGDRQQVYSTDVKKLTSNWAYKIGFFILAFFLFSVNLIAVALSLNCNNQGEPLGFRIASALYAFMFGFIYILVNFIGYRIKLKKEVCKINTNKPFIYF